MIDVMIQQTLDIFSNRDMSSDYVGNYNVNSVSKVKSVKFCKCGCGTIIKNKNKNGELFYVYGHTWRGRKRIGENRNQKGELNNNYKSGRINDHYGYIKIRYENHPRATKRGSYVMEHVLIMEKYVGRFITTKEVVHHINGIKDDNRLENLKLMTINQHNSLHHPKGIQAHLVGKFTGKQAERLNE